ncbi:MAG: PAS domain-containing protein [Novosphingobium sp.]
MGLLDFHNLFVPGDSGSAGAGGAPRAGDLVSPYEPPSGLPNGSLMADTRRQIAILNADMVGAHAHLGQFAAARGERRLFRDLIEAALEPILIIDPRPGLHIVDFNDAYAQITLADRRRIAGEKLFDAFPDNPDVPEADGVCNLYESLRRCAQSGRTHKMPLQRYDVKDRAGRFQQRHWLATNTPIFDDQRRLVFLAHRVRRSAPA